MNASCRFMSILALAAFATCCLGQHPFVTWRSSSGSTVRAKFVSLDDRVLTLSSEQGKELKVSIDQLDQTSKDLARAYARIDEIELKLEETSKELNVNFVRMREAEVQLSSLKASMESAARGSIDAEIELHGPPKDVPKPPEPSRNKWGWVIGVDEFGDETGKGQMLALVEGTFTNTATTGSPCAFLFGFEEAGGKGLVKDNGGVIFFVTPREYGSSPMTHFGDELVPFVLKIKLPTDDILPVPLAFSGGHLIFGHVDDKSEKESMSNLMSLLRRFAKDGGVLKCVIENQTDPQNLYRFDMPMEGYEAALDYLMSRRFDAAE